MNMCRDGFIVQIRVNLKNTLSGLLFTVHCMCFNSSTRGSNIEIQTYSIS